MNPVKLTTYQRRKLQYMLQETPDARVYQRTLAVLERSRGRGIAQIAALLGVTRQSVYNWVQTYLNRGDPSALHDKARTGRPRFWTEKRQALLRTLLETSPDRLGYFALNWTVPLLQEQIERETGQRLSQDTIRRELKRQDLVWKRFRYTLEPDPQREKKTLPQASAPKFEFKNGDCDRR